MRAFACAAALAFAVASAPALAHADDALAALERQQKSLYNRIAPSVVYIVAREGIGTGFVVGPEGLVLTNAHVVGKASEVQVVLFDGGKRTGKVVERAKDDIDLVLLDIGKHALPRLPMSDQQLEIGTWVAAIGHGLGTTWTYTTGMVSNTYPVDGFKGKPVFQTQIPLNHGNSGGPIFDRNGVVLGICTAGIDKAQNINFAIRAGEAVRQLRRLSAAKASAAATAALTVTAPAGAPLFVDGAAVGAGPRVSVMVAPGEHEVLAIIGGSPVRRKVTFPATSTVELTAP